MAPTTHKMKLAEPYYTLIKKGKKTYEARLYDEKRRELNLGDIIIFTDNDGKRPFRREIRGLIKFKDFASAVRYAKLKYIMPNAKSIKDSIKKYRGFGDGKYGKLERRLGVLLISWW